MGTENKLLPDQGKLISLQELQTQTSEKPAFLGVVDS